MKKLFLTLALCLVGVYANDDKAHCDSGDLDACVSLGVDYFKGNGGVEQDFAKALELYTKACDGGNMNGCFKIGVFYSSGKGPEKNDAKAMEYFKKACDGGLDKACIMAEHIN